MMNKPIYRTLEGKEEILANYENILTNWKKPFKRHLVETSFGTTFAIESGPPTGETIVFLHGSGSNSAMWLADVAVLSGSYRTFAIDIIGECGLSAESRPPFSGGNYSSWIKETLSGLGIEKTSIVGCSLGGWIAMDFAISEPEMTDKLVLLAPAGVTAIKVKTMFLLILASFTGQWGFKLMNKTVYGSEKIDPKAMEFISLVKNQYIPRHDVLPVLTYKELERIAAPTLFIGGDGDCFYDSRITADRITANIKTHKTIVLQGKGHVLTGITHMISNFLKNYNV